MGEGSTWVFMGYQSAEEGQPVQAWFDSLPEDDQYEIIQILNYLRSFPVCWDQVEIKEFDPLAGEGGISEIRVIPEIRREENGITKRITYRIYGVFGPNAGEYTFLHAWDKQTRTDTKGKRIARERLEKLTCYEADVHEFNFPAIPFQEA